MVALEKADLHSGVHQVHQSGEHTDIAFRDHIVVLVPEIPDVTQHVQCPRPVLRYGPQETDETSLPLRGVIDIKPQMDIRDKVRKGPVSHCHS